MEREPFESAGRSPQRLSSRERPDFDQLRDDVRACGRKLRTLTSAFSAEVYTAMFYGSWRRGLPDDVAPEDADALLVDVAMSHATESGLRKSIARIYQRDTIAILHALAAVAEPPGAELAKRGLALPDLAEAEVPEWAESIGRARPCTCILARDEFGDETDVLLTFAYADEPPHAITIRINHNLSGMASDIRTESDGERETSALHAEADADARRQVEDADPAMVRRLCEEAFATTEQVVDPPVTNGFRNLFALALAKLRLLPEGGVVPEPPQWSELGRSDLVADFVASPEAADLPAAAEAIASELVNYGADHDRGQPLRVSPTKLRMFLLGWLPHTGLIPRHHLDHLPSVLTAWVRYAGRRTGLSAPSLEETLAALPAITERVRAAYDDRSRWSPQRHGLEHVLADIDPDTADIDDVFDRRMFALPRLPDPDFDPSGPDAFRALVAEEHPARFEGEIDPSGERGLTVTTHAMLAQQLWLNDPPEVWTAAQRLLTEGFSRQAILRGLAATLATELQRKPQNGTPYNRALYAQALDALDGTDLDDLP